MKPEPQTATTRKAAERLRKREAGLKPLEVWAKPEHHEQIKALAARLASIKKAAS